MRTLLALIILSLSVPFAVATAQPQNVRLNAVATDPEEVSIAINPANPAIMIAGANIDYYYYSTDGGATWNESSLPAATFGDPCVIFDAEGRAYYSHLTWGWDAITVRTSDDGGATWSSGVKLFGPSSPMAKPGPYTESSLQDKEWMAVDLTNSPYRNNVYVAWTDFTFYSSPSPDDSTVIVFARSTDRGATFEPFVVISDKSGNSMDSDSAMEGSVPAVGPNGEVYVVWSGPDGLYFDRSFDGGVTWGEDKVLTSTPGGWNIDISGLTRANGFASMTVDISDSPFRGTISVVWVDERNSEPDVFIMQSTDKGEAWSEARRVNDDPFGNGKDQFFAWSALDPSTGNLAVVYYDRRRYVTDSTDVYLARSTDGGATFVNERISDGAFRPSPFVFFGDYNGISYINGHMRPIWTEMRGSTLSIHTALIDETVGIGDAAAQPASFEAGVFPNPAQGADGTARWVRFALPAAGEVRVEICDALGRFRNSVFFREFQAGEHRVSLTTETLKSGLYFCRLEYSEWNGARRVVVTPFVIL